MSFLNTAILAGLLAAALPFIIHFFTRSRSKRVHFSTLTFLKKLEVKNIRRLKIRQLLLLIIRTLVIVSLVFAFARPALKKSSLGAVPDAATTSVIVLDNSYSMGSQAQSGRLLKAAKTAARDIVNTHQSGDRIYFITATDTGDISLRAFQDFDALEQQIEALELSYQRADLDSALNRAALLLENTHDLNKEIYVISDFQRINFSSDSLHFPSFPVIAVPVHKNRSDNLALENVNMISTIFQVGKAAKLEALIANHGDLDIENRLVQLYLNGNRVAQSVISLDAGDRVTVPFKCILDKSGFQSGRIVLEEDDIAVDNRRFFTFYVPDGISVGLVNAQPYIKTALGPDRREDSPFELYGIDDLTYSDLFQYDVLSLARVSRLDASFCRKLADYVKAGNGVFLTLGTNLDVKNYNNVICDLLQLPEVVKPIGGSGSAFTIGQIDLMHPIFEGVFTTTETKPSDPVFQFALQIRSSAEIDPIIKYNTGDLFLFEKKLGSGSIVVSSSGFENETTDFIYKPLFAPLIFRTAGYLGVQNHLTAKEVAILDPLAYKLSSSSINKALTVERPNGRVDRVRPLLSASGTWVRYRQTDIPGIYTLYADDEILNQWSVNVNAAESDLSAISQQMLRQNFFMNIASADLSAFIDKIRFGHEVWPFLLIAALLMLTAEMFIYREK